MDFVDEPSEDRLSWFADGVAALVDAVPEILASSWGADVSGRGDSFDFALIFDFADRAAYERYRACPAHRRFIDVYMRAIPAEKARVQYVLRDCAGARQP